MKTHLFPAPRASAGHALMIVLLVTSVGMLMLAGALSWCTTNTNLNGRNNQYFSTLAAAEAATEKVVANLSRDYQSQGESLVYANLAQYRAMVPTSGENAAWSQYVFNDAQAHDANTYVQRLSAAAYVPLESQYQGVYGLASTYRVISNARQINSPAQITAAVRQDVQLASIPLFQFAIFYSLDLEINPGPTMNVTGRVHGNANIYCEPVNTLTFMSDVTASGKIFLHKSTNDPLVRSLGSSHVEFEGAHDANTSTVSLPVGTNNSPAAVRAILDVPPVGESPSSAMGQQRYYNKADLVIVVTDTGMTATSGAYDNFATSIPLTQISSFLDYTPTFYNKRELKTVKAIDIDVAKLKTWSETNSTLWAVLGRNISSVYVADKRTQTGSTESGVRVKNGQTLPVLGLTVATPNPLYVKGHFNAPAANLGTANTANTKPASLIGDAITVLSTAWNDSNSGLSISSRNASSTTVNAAFLGGIVSSDGAHYSGGVENFPRFLENWSGDILTYNGAMVVMFNSIVATAPWGGSDVYSPPNRNWAFDINFMDPAKLPPGTPSARALVRGQWSAIKAGSTSL